MSFLDDWNLSYPFISDDLGVDSLLVRGRTAGGGSAGQFEMAGSSHLPDGGQISASDIDGEQILFKLRTPWGQKRIGTSIEYPVNIVGEKVRISIQGKGGKRPNIGNLLAALLLMPDVGKVNDSEPLQLEGFADKTYWVDTVQTSVIEKSGNTYVLAPEQIVLATGSKSDAEQFSGAMFFDFMSRIAEIRGVCEAATQIAAGGVPAALKYYADVYEGNAGFDYAIGTFMREVIMKYLDAAVSDYRYGTDLLPALKSAVGAAPRAMRSHLKSSDTPAIEEPRNLIFFGAPGTGKSYQLNKRGVRTKDNPGGIFPEDHVRRVTFYPDYTYSQFVGSYRPFTKDGQIGYRYIAGPFLQTYLDASLHPYENYLIIIEELNRANPAAVFGDIFQLLDRNALGASEYAVSVPMEMSECIAEKLGELDEAAQKSIEDYFDPDLDFQDFCDMMQSHIELPPNLFIWATMNSADQGVFPMDTAFKRRWDFRYMGINEGENAAPAVLGGEKLSERTVAVAGGRVVWNKLRKGINTLLLDCGVNEDKLLGPFFLAPETLSDGVNESTGETRFVSSFEDKVLLYLYEDAGKMHRGDIFWNKEATFAGVCDKFERDGIGVFAQQSKKGKIAFAGVYANTEAVEPIQADED